MIISVSGLLATVRELIEDNFVEVFVQGELSNISCPPSGHCYFTIKDERAQLRCALFRSHARSLRFGLKQGMTVVCRGRVSIYSQRGDLQFLVEGVEPVGVGSLQLAFEQLKEKLHAEGLFAAERKQPLPPFPTVVGVVTSVTGAAFQDILNVLRRRSAGVQVVLRSVRVQGEGAAAEIAQAITELNQDGHADVLIVGRGGGSKEDLWAFNEEIVARAICASRIPVISAVGHEIDVTIADYVADLRAPTPSAAAELVVRHRLELERHLDQLILRLGEKIKTRLALLKSRVEGLERRLKSPQDLLRHQTRTLRQLELRLQNAIRMLLEQRRLQLTGVTGRLEALSPLRVLARGYAIATKAPSWVALHDVADIRIGEAFHLQLEHGALIAEVKEIEKINNKSIKT